MPSEEQTKKIITGIRKVAKELSAVRLVVRHWANRVRDYASIRGVFVMPKEPGFIVWPW